MKKKFIYIIIGLLLIGTLACKRDFLNLAPADQITTKNFFKTETDFQQALSGAYSTLRATHGGGDGSSKPWDLGEMRSDNTHFDLNDQNRGTGALMTEDIANFTDDAVNSYTTAKWNSDYSGISKVNTIIDRLPAADFADNLKTPIMGEAKFLRALWYFDLVQYFGRVPLQVHEVATESEASLPRSSTDEVYAQIIADATEAAQSLAAPATFPQSGRATKGAARTLLAKVYMVQKKYDLAQQALTEVINMGYRLNDDYAAAFLPANKNGNESVFEVQYLSTVGLSQQSSVIYSFLPNATGLSVITGAMPNSPNSGGYNVPTQNLIDSFEPNDKRLDKSIAIVEGTLAGNNFTPESLKSIVGYTTPAGKTARRTIRKFLHPHSVTNYTDDNWPVYRYADVLLSMAEALNEQGKPGEALPYLDQVRRRAGLPNSTVTDQAGLRAVILHERRIELAFENYRWLDLVRTGQAVQVMNAYGIQLKTILNNINPNAYNVTVNRLLFPVPQDELNRNVKMAGDQNPGY